MGFFRRGGRRPHPKARIKKLSHLESIPCGYCFQRWATGYDHLIPYSHDGLTIEENLYPCCNRCNSILSNKLFSSIEEKREYIRTYLILEGSWERPKDDGECPSSRGKKRRANLSKLREFVRENPTGQEILQRQVSLGSLAPEESKRKDFKYLGFGITEKWEFFEVIESFGVKTIFLSRHEKGNNRLLCPMCDTSFIPNRHQKYCSSECRSKAWLIRNA